MIPTRDAPTKPLGVKPQGIVHPNTYKELAKSGQSHGLTSSCEVTHTRSSIDIKYVSSEFRQVLHDTSVTADEAAEVMKKLAKAGIDFPNGPPNIHFKN